MFVRGNYFINIGILLLDIGHWQFVSCNILMCKQNSLALNTKIDMFQRGLEKNIFFGIHAISHNLRNTRSGHQLSKLSKIFKSQLIMARSCNLKHTENL